MSYSSISTADSRIEYKNWEDYLTEALVDAYRKALENYGIIPKDNKEEKFKPFEKDFRFFVQSGVWARHMCKTKGYENINQNIPLVLIVKIDEINAQRIGLRKKGDNLIHVDYLLPYDIGITGINSCESPLDPPTYNEEIVKPDCWLRFLTHKTEKLEEAVNKDTTNSTYMDERIKYMDDGIKVLDDISQSIKRK